MAYFIIFCWKCMQILTADCDTQIRTVQVRRFPIDPQALADNERLHRQHAERIVSGGASAEGGRGRRRGSREDEQRQRELAERIISETGVKRRSASRGREADEKRLAEERGREEERLRFWSHPICLLSRTLFVGAYTLLSNTNSKLCWRLVEFLA